MRVLAGIVWAVSMCLWAAAASAQGNGSDAAAPGSDWTGEWQTFWRDGLAIMTLRQDGDRVSGTYQPGQGQVTGINDADGVLRGTWTESGQFGDGEFIFALSEDGQSFTGRFGNGEYWNGVRTGLHLAFPGQPIRRETPRGALESLLLRANAAVFDGDAEALREADRLLVFPDAGEERDAADRNARRQVFWDILNLSTLRISTAPEGVTGDDPDLAIYPIGPIGVDETFDLTFRNSLFGWRVVLPPLEELEASRQAFLDALGHPNMAAFRAANASSPRTALFTFLEATGNWDHGGREAAFSVMDLGAIPERLRNVEGELLADYLWAVINRLGFVVRQEIPNLTDLGEPFVLYAHPVGNVVMEAMPVPGSDEIVWRFNAETFATIPHLFRSMQALPVAEGLETLRPLSDYFHLREAIRDVAPAMLTRRAGLELWQLVGIAVTVVAAWIIAAGVRWVVPRLIGLATGLRPGQTPDPRRLGRPVAVFVFLMLLLMTYTRLGLAQTGTGLLGRLLAVAVVIALAVVCFRLVGLIGGLLRRGAAQSKGRFDEIVTSLIVGLAKLVVVVVAIIAAADVVGLPYEGVLTGLGVGGVALAFAARDTVSNMLGGALLLADRPFKRDDLIDVNGTFASIDEVGLRSTKLRTLDDALLVVPNSHLSDQTIANWGKRRKRRTKMTIGVTYDTPADTLDTFCKEIVKVYKAQTWTDDEAVFVGVEAFGASSIDIMLVGHFNVTAYDRQVQAQHDLVLAIIRLAERMGVDFAFPTRTVHVVPTETDALAAALPGGGAARSHAAQ